jgi:hypothetical protein
MSEAAGGLPRRRRAPSVAIGVVLLVIVPLIVLGWQTQSDTPAAGQAAVVSGAEVLRAIELPRAAQDARSAGIAEADLQATLRMLQERGVRAADAREVLSAFLRLGLAARGEPLAPQVEQRLAAGVRGPALADALRASSRSLPPPDSARQRAPRPLGVPRDSAGERRPLRDTTQLPPPAGSSA